MSNAFIFLITTSLKSPFWVAGDTFPVGCAFDESIVHHKVFFYTFNRINAMFTVYFGGSWSKFIGWFYCSILRRIQITTIRLITLNMVCIRKDVGSTMCWCHGDTTTTCIWYSIKSIFGYIHFGLCCLVSKNLHLKIWCI